MQTCDAYTNKGLYAYIYVMYTCVVYMYVVYTCHVYMSMWCIHVLQTHVVYTCVAYTNKGLYACIY